MPFDKPLPQPTTYDRQSSFTTLASVNPSEPYTGADLDAEFNAVKVTLDEVLANLELIQRDDGEVANEAIGPDQLAASIDLGINSPTAWAALTAYSQYDTAFNGTSLYKATAAHTSGAVFATDLAAGKWVLLADFNVVAVADGSITTAKLADLNVTTGKLAGSAVTTAKITDLAVTTAKINDLGVTAAKLATNAVTTIKIQDEAVDADKLAADAVVTAKILDANVTSAKIADAAVSLAKMANLAQSTFIGRAAAAGTGAPSALSATLATAILNNVTGDSGAGGVKGLVPAPAAGDAAARKYLGAAGTWTQPAFGAPDVILEDQKTLGTDGGTFTSGADRTRTLNTEVLDTPSVCSLSANQFTLLAGTYYIEWSAPASNVSLNQSFLYNVTDAAEVKRGVSSYIGDANQAQARAEGQTTVTIAGSKAFEIRHRCLTTGATVGFGRACSFGTEIYTVVKIWKTA